MTPTESATILRQHNAWRRQDRDEPMEMQPPKLIGEAIDVAVAHLLAGELAGRRRAVPAKMIENIRRVSALADKSRKLDRTKMVGLAVLPFVNELLADPPVAEQAAASGSEPTENMIVAGLECDAWDRLSDAVLEKKGWPYSCRESAECVAAIYKAMRAAEDDRV